MVDLDLDVVRTRGRAKKQRQVEIVRELRREDLALLALERGIKPKPLQKIRDTHHAVARCIAEGKKDIETQLITGLSANRISILKGDPAFAELVSFYKEKVEEIRDQLNFDGLAKMVAVHSDCVDEMADRLNEDPKAIDPETLGKWTFGLSDRIGLGPQTKSTNLNVNLDLAARVSAGRARAERLSALRPPVIDALPAPEGELSVVRAPDSPPLGDNDE
jgi:hypothetical protein